VRIASARAGNVIGGGDWAKDRILPDCVRALANSQAIGVRNKTATRPWQHVLEPLSGYLWLAAVLSRPALRPFDAGVFNSAFNFGPGLDSNRTVKDVVTEVLNYWPGDWEDRSDPKAVHEAKLLNLAIDKAHHLLGWKPVMGFEKTVETTVEWYRTAHRLNGGPSTVQQLMETTSRQIHDYETSARKSGVAWAGA
jgi:CDP-glucose 4,6-dehydratase